MTSDEVLALFAVASPYLKLLYGTVYYSGLRANEVRQLSVADLDVGRGGLELRSRWTKNRRPVFQPLPASWVTILSEYAQGEEARDLYQLHYSIWPADVPIKPLLYVPTHTARTLDSDLEAANIPKLTEEGKLDFHALRTSFISLVVESDKNPSVKEAQELARHSTPVLTYTTYARTRKGRTAEIIESLDESIGLSRHYALSTHSDQHPIEPESATPSPTKGCANNSLVEAAGIEPASEDDSPSISTCVVGLLISSPTALTDRIRRGPVQFVSPNLPERLDSTSPL